jgi:DNA-binding GntR family transcriptional regulator
VASVEARRTARPTASEVYETLRSQILDNTIEPNTRVNIESVARRLGVSPTPVREALHRLQGDNLVTAASGRGYSTTALLNLPELRDLFEFRLLVEPWAARAAAVNRLSNPALQLRTELEALQVQQGSKPDLRQELVAHDARFHSTILSAAGNRVVADAFAQTHCHLHIFRLYPADTDGRLTVDEHRLIWEAIRNCEPDRAEEAMRRHLSNAYLRFAEAFADTDDGVLRPSAAPLTLLEGRG